MSEFNSSPAQFKDFIEGFIWKDIKRELLELRDVARDALEGMNDEKELYRFQGRAGALKDIITMIEGFGEEVEKELTVDVDKEGNPVDGLDDNDVASILEGGNYE